MKTITQRFPSSPFGAALAACLLAPFASATVTPYSWIRAGEFGLMADSSGANHPFNAAFSSGCQAGQGGGGLTAAVTTTLAAGGPLGTTGAASTVATRWGFYACGNSGMWIQGPNNSVPPPTQWSLPATNWVMECWVLPVGTGASNGSNDAQFMSTGSAQFNPAQGGAAFRSHFTTDGLGNDVVELRADSIGVNAGQIGDSVAVDGTRWTHLAVVNDAGVTTFYVNGAANGDPRSDVSAPTGVPYIGSGQDTGGAFNGYLDELRYSTFAEGQFAVADLLLLPPGPGFISKPQSASVWEGGAAPFETVTTLDPDATFLWKRGADVILGANGPDYLLPAVTPPDSGAVFSVTVSSNGVSAPPAEATLTVVPVQTANNDFYRGAVQSEASLLAFFPIDGNTGASVTNVKDGTHNAALHGTASYDGRTDRSYGERALRLRGGGDALIPANPAYEFADGTGTIEALVYLENPAAQHSKTIFSVASEASSVYYAVQAGPDGNSLLYKNDATAQAVSWAVSPSLVGRLAHVAFVFTAGKVTAFVDGVALGIKDNPNFGAVTGLQANIGSSGIDVDGNPLEPWNGSIDEVAIYGDALSDNAIAIHNSRFIYGTAVTAPTIESAPTGTYNLLSGGAPIFRVKAAGTAPLTYTWKLNGVPVANNPTASTATFTVLNSTAASSGVYTVTVTNPIDQVTSDPGVTVNFTDPSPTDKYAGYVLADGPAAYWRLNETTGTVLKDYAGGLDGTYVPDSVDRGVDGPFGIDPDKATHFKAAAGVSASVPYTPTLNPTGPFSIEFWVKPDQSGQINLAVLATQNRNAGRSGYAIYQGFNGNFWEAHLGFADSVLFLNGTTSPVAGRWDHVVVTWNGSDLGSIYVNGNLEGTVPGGPHRNNLVQPLEIGSRFNGTLAYPGTIDEVAFYNYALTPAQVEHHFSIAYYPSSITAPPAPVPNGQETDTITLVAGVTGFPNTYQWFKDGVALDDTAKNPDDSPKYPQGVNGSTLAISQAIPGDNGQYHLAVTNPLGNSATSPVAVTVALDTTPPTVAYVTASATLNRVRVGFNKPMATATLATGTYTFTGGLTKAGVTVTSDPSVIDITTTGMVAGGSYSLSISGVTDARISENPLGANNTPFAAYVLTPGVLAWDYYRGIDGSTVDSLKSDAQYPDGVWTHQFLSSFDSTSVTINNDLRNNPAFGPILGEAYGARVYGWITPTETADYTFFLKSDDASELWISSDATPDHVALAAFESECCEGFKEPGADETSPLINLKAGQSYYIEAVYKEGGGGDYVQVAWRKDGDATPAGSLTPIPGSFLSSYAPVLGSLNVPVVVGDQVTLTWTGAGYLQQSADLVTWTDVPGYPASGYTTTVPAGSTAFYRLQQ